MLEKGNNGAVEIYGVSGAFEQSDIHRAIRNLGPRRKIVGDFRDATGGRREGGRRDLAGRARLTEFRKHGTRRFRVPQKLHSATLLRLEFRSFAGAVRDTHSRIYIHVYIGCACANRTRAHADYIFTIIFNAHAIIIAPPASKMT